MTDWKCNECEEIVPYRYVVCPMCGTRNGMCEYIVIASHSFDFTSVAAPNFNYFLNTSYEREFNG